MKIYHFEKERFIRIFPTQQKNNGSYFVFWICTNMSHHLYDAVEQFHANWIFIPHGDCAITTHQEGTCRLFNGTKNLSKTREKSSSLTILELAIGLVHNADKRTKKNNMVMDVLYVLFSI